MKMFEIKRGETAESAALMTNVNETLEQFQPCPPIRQEQPPAPCVAMAAMGDQDDE
ncbi:hypothetical protein QEZ40_004523 [Streptomyces katrae]|uniref:Uncharacterized protein n=1 Tax=Streptomyces katrae TaxID=68223 RepID=A0ABT7GP49_9ACTN|nr:hypothetical protein [Streptomyces katrae]MDK9495089.1 hypothetical protein [Streptomyces katrae]